MFAKVIVDIAHAAVDRAFTYRIPEGLEVLPGHHVLLPFGQGNHVKEGFVLSVSEKSGLGEDVSVKDVLSCLEPYTVLLQSQIALAEWMQEAYHCLLVDALRLMIPAQLRGSRIHEKRERIVYLADPAADFASRSHLQTEVVALLKKTGQPMSVRDIQAFVPGASAAITALLKKRVLSESSFTVFRRPEYGAQQVNIPELTPEQHDALFALDILDENHDEKEKELVSPLTVTKIENLNEKKLSDDDMAALVGKTGAELLDSGWTTGMGYDLESMEFYLEYAPFAYTVTFEKQEQLENTDDFDEEAAVASLKVVSVSFSGLGNSATEIPEYSEEFADE